MYNNIPDTNYWPNQVYCPCCGKKRDDFCIPPLYPSPIDKHKEQEQRLEELTRKLEEFLKSQKK